MLILHGTVNRDQFLLWAEKSDSPPYSANASDTAGDTTPAAPNNYIEANTKPLELLPFAASCAEIRESLSVSSATSAIDISLPTKTRLDTLSVIWIPESDDMPLASSPMIGRSLEDADLATVHLAPWQIPAIELTTEQLVNLLCYCVDTDLLAEGVALGKDLQFWALAMRFAGMLVVKQQFLPGLKLSTAGSFASWDPVFPGEDGEKLALLAKGMPESCMACMPAYDENNSRHASELLAKFLGRITDYLVRTSFQGKMPPVADLIVPQPSDSTTKNIHQRWLEALLGANSRLNASHEEIVKLSDQIAEWRRPIEIASDAPFRLCLRLEEPVIEQCITITEGTVVSDSPNTSKCSFPWYVRFLLQSLRDPGLFLPVESVLSPEFEDLQLLRGGRISAREYLFRSLGQAVRLCPDIEKSFTDAIPRGFMLDTNGAYEFLAKTAPVLKTAGFSVQMPNWWKNKHKISAKAGIISSQNEGTLLRLKQLAHFDWQLALGGAAISTDELEKLALLKLPLINWHGMWVELNPEQLTPVLKFFKANAGKQKIAVPDLIKMALGGAELPEGVRFDGIIGEGSAVNLIKQLQGQANFEELPVDRRFCGQLRPYQQRGMSWLMFLRQLGFGACLADDMGLGKTVQTLAFIQNNWYKQKASERHPTLLVCPTSVIGNWQKEINKFTPDLNILVHHGIGRHHGAQFLKTARRCAIVLTSYAMVHRDHKDLKSINWDLVILDEAQNIKNAETRQAIAACALPSKFRIALTGTPVENSVGDLWSLMNFINPGLLGGRSEFKEEFLKPIQIFQDQEKTQKLKSLTAPFILRRLKTDKTIVTDLPEKFERKTQCYLTKEQASLYAGIAAEATNSLENSHGIKRKSIVLTTLLRLKQICDHPALVLKDKSRPAGRSGKLKRLAEMLEHVLSNEERALIFTQFTEMGSMIRNYLQNVTGREVLFLHGGTSRRDRDHMVERFQSQNEDSPQLFVLSLKAGGTGLNLTKANHVFHYDRWWNPAVENQATDRAFRIGQEKNVEVHKFICAGTLEERIDEIIERKGMIAESTIGAGEGWLTELSNAELKDVFSLKDTVLIE